MGDSTKRRCPRPQNNLRMTTERKFSMTQTLQFRYYYKNQSEQFHFYKIPKVLFTDARFKGLSAEAKILYGLMLDRMSLSMKNGWMDNQNRIYIYFTLEDAVELLGCGHGKAVRLFSELDSVKGIGLIERKKQGQGKPAKIYVKNFLEDEAADGGSDENKTSQNRNSEKGDFQGKDEQFSQNGNSQQGVTSDFQKSALLKKESQDIPFSGSLDFSKSNGNNTDLSKTERNDTESFYDSMDGMERAREKQEMEQLIRRNIEYDVLFLRNPSCDREIDEIVSLMTEVATSRRSMIHLDKQDIPQPMVKERLLSLQCEHIEYVLERMQSNTAKIHNIRSYLLTALYHAPETIHHYYAAQMRED